MPLNTLRHRYRRECQHLSSSPHLRHSGPQKERTSTEGPKPHHQIPIHEGDASGGLRKTSRMVIGVDFMNFACEGLMLGMQAVGLALKAPHQHHRT
jgi:hypothetical protein